MERLSERVTKQYRQVKLINDFDWLKEMFNQYVSDR